MRRKSSLEHSGPIKAALFDRVKTTRRLHGKCEPELKGAEANLA